MISKSSSNLESCLASSSPTKRTRRPCLVVNNCTTTMLVNCFVPGPIVAIGVGMRDRTIAAPYLVLLFLHKVAVRLEGGPTPCGTSAYGPKLTSAQSATMSASDPKRT